MLRYKAIEIFTNEAARCHKKPLVDAVIQYVRELKIAARCIVTRGLAGCYESGEVATNRLEVLSFNQPVRIYIAVPAAEADRVLDGLNGMLEEGIIAVSDLNVVSYRAPNTFFPRQLKVRDVMTPDPQKVGATTALSDVVRVLIGAWQWLAAFAPEGFFEIWGILPAVTTLRDTTDSHWRDLAAGILCSQKFYRSLGRNGYNLGLLLLEDGSADLELRAVLSVRGNYAPWVRSDFSGFEVMLGDMATFCAPEQTAEWARAYWPGSAPVAKGC